MSATAGSVSFPEVEADLDRITCNHSDYTAALCDPAQTTEGVTLKNPDQYAPLALGGGSWFLSDASLDKLSAIAAQQWTNEEGQPLSRSQARSLVLGGPACPDEHCTDTRSQGETQMEELYYHMATNNIPASLDAATMLGLGSDPGQRHRYFHMIQCSAPSCRSKAEYLGPLLFEKDAHAPGVGCPNVHAQILGHPSYGEDMLCDDPSHRSPSMTDGLNVISISQDHFNRRHDPRSHNQGYEHLQGVLPWAVANKNQSNASDLLSTTGDGSAAYVGRLHLAYRAIESRAAQQHSQVQVEEEEEEESSESDGGGDAWAARLMQIQ
ncbi:hypothetical protein I317_04037 [Kwoniella heveanensis CBS 569]|nr:hypothetical protein I317_04037 [Kwoniella heveanensis CBS 569]